MMETEMLNVNLNVKCIIGRETKSNQLPSSNILASLYAKDTLDKALVAKVLLS